MKSKPKPLYITFEGIDGSGKTYYLEKIMELINKKGISHKYELIPDTRLSGLGLNIFESLRTKDKFFRHGYPISEFLCFAAVDIFDIEKIVIPALKQNKTVIQDRGIDTLCLYAAIQFKDWLNRYKQFFRIKKELSIIPDFTFLFLSDFEKCISRAEKRDNKSYTSEERNFLKKVDAAFRKLVDLQELKLKNSQKSRSTCKRNRVGDEGNESKKRIIPIDTEKFNSNSDKVVNLIMQHLTKMQSDNAKA